MAIFKSSGGVSWLLVCLGNPGKQYENTRHNIGFLTADEIERRSGVKINKLRYRALTGEVKIGGQRVLVLKPQTYMNLSGESVGEAARFYKIPPEHVLVISDDISIGTGKLRIRPSGSAGGHNGLKSIIQHLGSDQFPRIKVGVGSPQHAEHDIVDWVIGKPMGEDAKVLTQALEKAAEAVSAVIAQGPQKAMNKYNG